MRAVIIIGAGVTGEMLARALAETNIKMEDADIIVEGSKEHHNLLSCKLTIKNGYADMEIIQAKIEAEMKRSYVIPPRNVIPPKKYMSMHNRHHRSTYTKRRY